jgi:hypothetical protein
LIRGLRIDAPPYISAPATPKHNPPSFKKSETLIILIALLAVTNDHFYSPIIIQNKRNKHAFDTYAYTTDLVPLVLEKSCFAGYIFEYKWKINKTKQ